MTSLKGVVEALKESRLVMVCSHVDPDGDSIGSQLAMASLLTDLGKKVAIVNQDPVPGKYRFLDSQGLIGTRLPNGFHPDTAAMLDCSSLERLGEVKALISSQMLVITIDHHPSSAKPDDPAYLNPTASSTGELLVDLIRKLEMPIGQERAVPLFAAILTDTGGFRFPNTTAKCLAVAAELAADGANPNAIAAQVYGQFTESSLKLLGRALGKIETFENSRICVVCLDQKDLDVCQARPEETQGIVEHLLSVKGCLVGAFLRETAPGSVKVSLRSRGPIKANQIAESLGGGGHTNAAGYRTKKPLFEARNQVVQEIEKWL
jgi:phosphoesterase RecJ-like protein